MLHPLAVARLAKKTCDGGSILSQFFAEDLYGDDAMVVVMRAEDGGGSAFTHFALQRISGNRLSDEILTWHAANLIPSATRRKRTERARDATHWAIVASRAVVGSRHPSDDRR
jgi:hypothetical protein